MTPSDARTVHRPLAMFGSRSRQLRASLVFHRPFSDMPSPLPRWTARVRVSIASPRLRAFPVMLAGRRPHCSFRGLLGVHSRYGLPDRSAAQGDLCHEASAPAVARQSRSSASEPNRQLLGWSLPPTGLMVVSRRTTQQEHPAALCHPARRSARLACDRRDLCGLPQPSPHRRQAAAARPAAVHQAARRRAKASLQRLRQSPRQHLERLDGAAELNVAHRLRLARSMARAISAAI
jgi:hypothetical protein